MTTGDGYSINFASADIARNNGYIVANTLNGEPLPQLKPNSTKLCFPLQMIGSKVSSGQMVGNIASIELVGLPEPPTEIPTITIIKYAPDEVTIINQTTVDHVWMEANLPVIGDGVTIYKYQGITFDPDDLWDPTETKGMTPPKIANAIKGTRVSDLCDLVGGMAPGTEVTFVATDGWETTLPYDAIYPDPHVYSHLGDTVIAWYADGNYVPQYSDGPRLFFAPEDHIAGQWNMNQGLPEQYWHYYYDSGAGIFYPSVAGLSAKYVSTIRIYSAPLGEWVIVLDGRDIGGLYQDVSRSYFESALTCQFGAEHQAEYTDSSGRTWSGMPLWFLAGFVDDGDLHSNEAFNETLAAAGYDIIVTASDGFKTTIPSELIIRNNNYIVANALNGTRFAEDDGNWPLRLTGQNVTGGMSVREIASIDLVPREVTPVTAEFSASITSGKAPLTVLFTDTSTGMVTTRFWDFGDGTTTWTNGTVTVSHTYSVPGTFTVSLTAGNQDGQETMTKPGYIQVTSSGTPPVAWFTASPLVGPEPLTVSFADQSWGSPTVWQWDFGDGNTSSEQNPSHTYAAAGKYKPILTVAGSGGSSSYSSLIWVSGEVGFPTFTPTPTFTPKPTLPPQSGLAPWAFFVANTSFGSAPMTVQFTDWSFNAPESWAWDFGDGTTSMLQNPVTTFAEPGTYRVSLIVTNAYGESTTIRRVYVR